MSRYLCDGFLGCLYGEILSLLYSLMFLVAVGVCGYLLTKEGE